MNATPIRPGSNEHEDLARLLPPPAERDLPSDRHRQLQEFVMNHIRQDLRPPAQGPRRLPKRLADLTAPLAAVAAVAVVAVAVGTGVLGDAGTPVASGGNRSTAPAPASGQQILLAAATTAEKTFDGTGAYWYVKVVETGSRDGKSWQEETWTGRDGRTWSRSTWQNPAAESATPSEFPDPGLNGKAVEVRPPNPLSLGGAKVTIEQLQALPTAPAALQARIAELVRNSDIRTSTGKLTDAQREQFVFEGLVSLVSQLPAPPKVRAAALRAIATYPNVTSLGAVDGGQGLLISFYPGEPPARLVIDPTSGQLRRTNVLVNTFGGTLTSDGGIFAVTAEWTDTLPR
jgi:hypothetical protein